MLVQFRTNRTIHSAGPNFRPKEIGPGGVILDEGNNDILVTLLGEIATLEAAEAAKILRLFGGEVVSEPAPQNCLDAIAAYDKEQAAKYRDCKLKPDDLAGRVSVSGERDGGRPW